MPLAIGIAISEGFSSETNAGEIPESNLLLETGDNFLLESGGYFLTE